MTSLSSHIILKNCSLCILENNFDFDLKCNIKESNIGKSVILENNDEINDENNDKNNFEKKKINKEKSEDKKKKNGNFIEEQPSKKCSSDIYELSIKEFSTPLRSHSDYCKYMISKYHIILLLINYNFKLVFFVQNIIFDKNVAKHFK